MERHEQGTATPTEAAHLGGVPSREQLLGAMPQILRVDDVATVVVAHPR